MDLIFFPLEMFVFSLIYYTPFSVVTKLKINIYLYVSNHMRKITLRVQESLYQYGTPYLYSDFF